MFYVFQRNLSIKKKLTLLYLIFQPIYYNHLHLFLYMLDKVYVNHRSQISIVNLNKYQMKIAFIFTFKCSSVSAIISFSDGSKRSFIFESAPLQYKIIFPSFLIITYEIHIEEFLLNKFLFQYSPTFVYDHYQNLIYAIDHMFLLYLEDEL